MVSDVEINASAGDAGPRPRPRVLIIIDYYLPGFRSGGPVQSIANLVSWLGDEIDFWVVTRDRDVTAEEPYPDVRVGEWNQMGLAKVFYVPAKSFRLATFLRRTREVKPDFIYLNSFFSPITVQVLLARKLGLIRGIRTIVAPRGEFGQGALGLKRTKKMVYSILARDILFVTRNLRWQATCQEERENIKRFMRVDPAQVISASNLPERKTARGAVARSKTKGTVHFVFCSRITRKKNLAWVIRLLARLRGEITFDIIGPIRDPLYWEECTREIESLPPHVRVTSYGGVPHNTIAEELEKQHFFVLPTLNENFGHAILEGLAAGCPVVVSDQTPWRELAEKEAGWDLPLDENLWVQRLQACVDCNQDEFDAFSRGAVGLAEGYFGRAPVEDSRKLFRDVEPSAL